MKFASIIKVAFIALTFSVLTPLSTSAQNDGIERFFSQYVDDEAFTMVYITPKLFQMIAKLDINDPDYQQVKGVLNDVKGLRILVYEAKDSSDAEHAHCQQLYKDATKRIDTRDYELLMSVRSEGDNVRFFSKESNKRIDELLMIVGSDDEFVLLSFVGNLDLEKLSQLANKMDVKGVEHLKELQNSNSQPKPKTEKE